MKLRSAFEKILLFAAVVALVAAAACEKDDSESAVNDPGATTSESEAESAGQAEPTEPDSQNAADEQAGDEQAAEASAQAGDAELVGRVSRAQIEKQRDDWRQAVAQASPDAEVAKELSEVEPGAKLTIYFGIWCSDCQRELPRFFKATDIAGEVPFTYELIGVDKYFRAGEVSEEPLDLAAIPAFIVERDGEEVGRVIEASPSGIEADLLALLRAEKTGVISATK